jgi:two-component system, OmpR family, response regulator
MRILLIEDDPRLRAQLRAALQDAGYTVDEADNGQDAQFLGETETFDAVVLDLGLPVMDGLTVLKRWRAAGRTVPVLVLTARDHWHEKVAGIDAGADDYLTKPFHLEELLARVRALIRRASGQASALLQCGDLVLDTRSGRVTCAGQAVPLTAHEYKVLDYFMHRPGELVSRGALTEHIYAQDFDRDSNTIEVFVGRLRKKLVSASGAPAARIETVRGLGYRLVPP